MSDRILRLRYPADFVDKNIEKVEGGLVGLFDQFWSGCMTNYKDEKAPDLALRLVRPRPPAAGPPPYTYIK